MSPSNVSHARFIASYDRPETLFYLDPPYFGNERDYGDGMVHRDELLQIMAEVLATIKGRFILINDKPRFANISSPSNKPQST